MIRDQLNEEYPGDPKDKETFLLFMTETEYDAAIIGVTDLCHGTGGNNHQVVYDKEKVIEINMEMGMDETEAIDHFYYNQSGAYMGKNTPIFMSITKNIIGE
jgi:hypothetical protein